MNFDMNVLLSRLTNNQIIVRHGDLPFSVSFPGERSFPSEDMVRTFTSVASGNLFQGTYAGSVGSNTINDLYVSKEVTIPDGLSGNYAFRDYTTKQLRTAYFSAGSNVRTLVSPLLTASGTSLTTSTALNITYVLTPRI